MARPLLALLAITSLAALALWYWRAQGPRNSIPPEAEPPQVRQPAVPNQKQVAPPDELRQGDAQERHLVGVVLREVASQSQAHIMRRGVTGVYRLQDAVPPDKAVLTAIRMDSATLQPPDGKEIVLHLENLSDEERFLYSPEVNLDEVEDVVGNLYEAETPEGKALLEKYPDPHASCGALKDEAEQQRCEARIDAEMEAAAAKCEQLDDPDEFDQCLETAYRLTSEAAARAKAQ